MSQNNAVEASEKAEPHLSSVDADDGIDRVLERKVRLKCDLKVMPPTFIIFLLTFLDRVNIGNARLVGLEKDLNMHGHDFNVVLLIIFIPLLLFNIPENMIMKRLNPSTWLAGLLFGCGVLTACQGVVKSFGGLIACRFVLGIFESGISSGCTYLISMYYPRYELPRRLSWWYISPICASAFGGLLAYAISNMDGLAGYRAWRWIFIIEGLMSVVVSVIIKFWMPDWPDKCGFLNAEEKIVLFERLARVKGATVAQMNRLDKPALKRIAKDWKIYAGTLMFLGIVNLNYATNYFVPTILSGLGWKAQRAQVMSIPIYCVAGVVCLATSYVSDKIRQRYTLIVFGTCLSFTGLVILLCSKLVTVNVRYMALFFVAAGSFTVQPIAVAWLANNVSGHYKRAVATAAQIGVGQIGGIVASNIFFPSEAPWYPTGYGVCLALLMVCAAAATFMVLMLRWENGKRDRGERDGLLLLDAELDNLGDDHPEFRFNY